MASSVNKSLAKERIAAELQKRGWNVFDHAPQKYDQMGYRSGGGYWCGLAIHPNYPGVVAGVDVYNAAQSGKDCIDRQSIPGAACAPCSGSGIEPNALDYAAAVANPSEAHKVKRDRENGVRYLISSGTSPVRQYDYHDDGSPKCLACQGRGHEWACNETVRWTWPEFQPTPKGKAWHVEAGGKIRQTGVGLSYCDSYNTGWERSVERFVNEIETAAKAAYAAHNQQSAATAAAAAIGDTSLLPTEASSGDFSVKVEYVAIVHSRAYSTVKSIITTTPRLAKPDWLRLRDGFGVSYDRKSGEVSKGKFVTAQEVLDFLVPPSAEELAARAAAPTTPAATEAKKPAYAGFDYGNLAATLPIRLEQRTNADGTTSEVGILDGSSLAQRDQRADEAAAEEMRYLLINADRLDAVHLNRQGIVRQIGGYIVFVVTAHSANAALISVMQSLAHASPKVYQTYDEVVSEAERLHAQETDTVQPTVEIAAQAEVEAQAAPVEAEAQAVPVEAEAAAEAQATAIYMLITLPYDRAAVLPPNTKPLARCGDFEIVQTDENGIDALYNAMNRPDVKASGVTLMYSTEFATFEEAVAKAHYATFTRHNLASLTESRNARIAVYNPETDACAVEMYEAESVEAPAVETAEVEATTTTDDPAEILAALLYNISMLEDAELAEMTGLRAGIATADFQNAWIEWGWLNPGPLDETVAGAYQRYRALLDTPSSDTRWLVALADAETYLGFSARWDGEALGRWRLVRVEQRDVQWQAMRLASGMKGGITVHSNREAAVAEMQLQHECDTPRHEAAPAVEVVEVVEAAPAITEVEVAPVADTTDATAEQQFTATKPKAKRGKTASEAVQWSMF